MNRRGILDKGIEALPIFVAVFGIMLVYTLIMAGVFGTHKLSDRDAVVVSTNMPVVFDKISVKNSSGQLEDTTFIGGVRQHGLDEEMKNGLREIAPSDGCLFLHYKVLSGPKHDKQEMVVFQDKVERESKWIDDFTGKGLLTYIGNSKVETYTFSFLNPEEKYYVEAYSGRCIDEQ